MSENTNIQWTDATWNPVTGCTRVSEGCRNCYAEQLTATRLAHQPKYAGLAVLDAERRGHWTNLVRCHEDVLPQPLHWRKLKKIFVCDMSDLFHPDVPFEFIDQVFAVMALCPQHTFQVLTKRPERMELYVQIVADLGGEAIYDHAPGRDARQKRARQDVLAERLAWPLPNVWLGTSVEDQATLDARVPYLLNCPAAVRFLSVEPLLGEIDLHARPSGRRDLCIRCGQGKGAPHDHPDGYRTRGLDLIIVGGESGMHARPCDTAWILGIIEQCRAASVACFVKQLGSFACDEREVGTAKGSTAAPMPLRHSHGGDPLEWPEHLRVREWPKVEAVPC